MAATRKRASARAPTARRGARGGGRSRRRGGVRRGVRIGLPARPRLPRLPPLDQRGRDVLGLALVAMGVFMGFVLYGGWDGGRAGHGLAVALGWLLGRARVLAPVTLVVAGGVLLLRPVLPALRPLRAGAICLYASITLALAAGTLGVSSGPGARDSGWTSAFLQAHGGVVGEALYQATHRMVQGLGVNILVVFLFLVGVILLSGASLASVLRATGSGVVDTTRRVRGLADARTAANGRQAPPADPGEDPEDHHADRAGPVTVPDPDPGALVVRATHVEG